MMRKTIYCALLLMGSLSAISQDSPTILTIDGQKISKAEFEAIYKKNNRDADVTPTALDEYSELFINFKLKVREAERLKMDTAKKFINELKGYRNQLARPYLIDSDLSDRLVKEAYDRMTEEINASHLLIKCDANALPADTLAAYNKILAFKKQAESDTDFSELASKESDDPSAKTNGGNLGYFTSMQMVYPFETAAYNTEVGKVSDIVRTRFGYHILKVHDRRAARGEVKTAHIMVKSTEKDDEEKKAEAEQRIKQIHSELLKGEKWEKMVIQFSDDKSTKQKGGELPWFGTGKMVKEFEDAAFGLEANDDFSKPVQTPYGWHVIKRIDWKGVPKFEEKKKELQSRIAKDSRAQMSKKSFLARVKDEYGFKENVKSLDAVKSLVDSTIFVGNWRPGNTTKYKKPLFSIGKKKFLQSDFIEYLRENQGRTREKDVSKYVNEKYGLYMDRSLTEHEDALLESKYPDFKALMQEYRDGILLFELTDKKVWSKAIEDTLGLKSYYDANKNDFKYGERAKARIFYSKNAETAQKVMSMVKSGKGSDEINKMVNQGSQLNLTIVSGDYEKEDEEITELVEFRKGTTEIHMLNGQHVFMDIEEVLPPEVKAFDKIKGLVTAGYQNQLEKEWIEELRSKYSIELNKEVLHSIR